VSGDYVMVNKNDVFTRDMFGGKPRKQIPVNMGKSRKNDPSTSVNATKDVNIGLIESEVLWAISHFPDGCIYDDVVALLPHRRVHSIQPRFAPLLRKRLIFRNGDTRTGASGRQQRVMFLNLKGKK
jgi:hypothetical protein